MSAAIFKKNVTINMSFFFSVVWLEVEVENMSSKRRGRIDSTWCISPASAGFGGVGQCHLVTGISNKIALQILLILVLEMGNQGKNIVTVSASPTPVAGQKALVHGKVFKNRRIPNMNCPLTDSFNHFSLHISHWVRTTVRLILNAKGFRMSGSL